MKNHCLLMTELKSKHVEIANLLQGKVFHYIEIPIHDNIGDLLIMQGTLKFLAANKLRPKTMSTTQSFKSEWVAEGDVLVFQGGGNFGDIYSNIHENRERLVSSLPNNEILILPQTIYFSSETARNESAILFRKHKRVHLFVRDRLSLELSKNFTDHVYLVPDMAHQLYPIRPKGSTEFKNIRIQRVDSERPCVGSSTEGNLYDTTTDWINVIGSADKLIKLIWRFESLFNRWKFDKFTKMIVPVVWLPLAQRFSNRATTLFSKHEHVFTDRLHGHILACLMDKPNTVFDNSYGKNSAYMKQWTLESDIVSLRKAHP